MNSKQKQRIGEAQIKNYQDKHEAKANEKVVKARKEIHDSVMEVVSQMFDENKMRQFMTLIATQVCG